MERTQVSARYADGARLHVTRGVSPLLFLHTVQYTLSISSLPFVSSFLLPKASTTDLVIKIME